MSKKALITGVTGMVGSHLADFLLENTDWEVYGVCRWRSPLDNVSHLLDRVNKKDRLFFEYADLNDEISLMTAVNKIMPDYIFHLAAQSYPLTSFTAPIDTLNTNILGTCRLLETVDISLSYMCVLRLRYSERYLPIRSPIRAYTKNVLSTLHHHMQYLRWVQIFWEGIMRKPTA